MSSASRQPERNEMFKNAIGELGGLRKSDEPGLFETEERKAA